MTKAKERYHMPGYEVDECDKTVKRLLTNVGEVAHSLYTFAVFAHDEDPDESGWDWGAAGTLSAALCSLKDVCRLLGVEYKEY